MGRIKKLPSGMWKRGDAYYARFRHKGQLVRRKLATDFSAAKDILNEMKARASRGDFGLLDNNYRWEDLKAEFLRWARQAVRNPGEYDRDLERFEKYLKVHSIRQIDQNYVLGFREWRLVQTIRAIVGQKVSEELARTVSPRTVNREVATLHNMLNKGVEWKRIGSNPIAGVEPLRNDDPRKSRRALSLAEVESLFEYAPAWLLPVLRLFCASGLRHNELVDLRFSDIDFDRQCLTIRPAVAKNKKAREIPLDDYAMAVATELRDGAKARQPVAGHTPKQTAQQAAAFSRDHVFVTSANTPLRNNLLRAFYATCKRAGIEGAEPGGTVDLHSLRVTFTTLTLEHGASPKAVQAILGHSTLALTMGTYAKATERSKRDAVGVLPFLKVSAPPHVASIERRLGIVAATETTILARPLRNVGR
jgi:integrase